MEETKMEKQNRMLKIILLVILIPIVSIVSILAYHFLAKSSDSSQAGNQQLVNNSVPNASTPIPATTPAIVAAVTPNPVTTPTTPNPANTPSVPNPVARSHPFVGTWTFTNPNNGEKDRYIFKPPTKTGNSEVGEILIIETRGKERSFIYKIVGVNQLQTRDDDTAPWQNSYYDVYDNGKAMNFSWGNGNSISLSRSR